MAFAVTLDNQMFWTQPRKRRRGRANSPKCRPIMPRAVERSTHEPIYILDCESTSDGIDGAGRAGDNVQSGGVVRLRDVPLGQELVVNSMGKLLVLNLVQFDNRSRLTEAREATSSGCCIESRGDGRHGSSGFATS